MMIIVKLFVVVMAGIAGHRAYEPTIGFGPRWGSLLRYAIGLLLFIPYNQIVKTSLPLPGSWEEDTSTTAISSLLTAGALGTGVMIGHIMDKK